MRFTIVEQYQSNYLLCPQKQPGKEMSCMQCITNIFFSLNLIYFRKIQNQETQFYHSLSPKKNIYREFFPCLQFALVFSEQENLEVLILNVILLLVKVQRFLTKLTMALGMVWIFLSWDILCLIRQNNFLGHLHSCSILIWFTIATGNNYSVWTPEENGMWKKKYLL